MTALDKSSDWRVTSFIRTEGVRRLEDAIKRVHQDARTVASILDRYQREGPAGFQCEPARRQLQLYISQLATFIEALAIVRGDYPGPEAMPAMDLDDYARMQVGIDLEALTAALL
jgi:hypothetical protein